MMTGLSSSSIREKRACPRAASRSPSQEEGICRNSPISAPATKALSPAPVMIRARTVSSSSARPTACSSSSRVSRFRAFNTLGRCMVIWAQPSPCSHAMFFHSIGLTTPSLLFRRLAFLFLRRIDPLPEIRVDEHVDFSVHDRLNVPHFHLRPVVLHHAVGVEHVRADLVAPADLRLFPLQFGQFLFPLLHHPFVQAGLQDLHRPLPVLDLGALRLAGDDDP